MATQKRTYKEADEVGRVERLRNSVNGNPQFAFHTRNHGVLRTKPNASIAYEIVPERYENQPIVIFTINQHGRVVDVEIGSL